MSGPLKGVTVIDLTTTLSGPYATLLLADLGADVVKVESPGGDPVRGLGPRMNKDMGAVFINLNRSKRSVVLDLGDPAGRQSLYRLASTADVLIHNMRPSAAQRCQVTAPQLRAQNPRLIHCAIRGYGEGPYGDRPAYDDVVQAGSGIAAQQAWVAGQPQYVASAVSDKVAGMLAALAISAALVQQKVEGSGCAIEIPMFESSVAFGLIDHLYGRTFVPPLGPACYPRQASPGRRPYRTQDGYIVVVLYTDSHWERFLDVVGRSDLRTDKRFASLHARAENVAELALVIEAALASNTTAGWLRVLTEAGIPVGAYNSVDDLFDEEHLNQSGLLQGFEHPSEGPLLQVASPIVIDGTRSDLGRPSPRLGEHNEEVLGPDRPVSD